MRAARTVRTLGAMHARLPIAVIFATLALLALGAPVASASDDDDREVRVRSACAGGAVAELKLDSDDGRIDVELEVDQNRRGVSWRVVLVHERRVAWRGTARTAGSSGSFSIERRLRDLPGYDTVTARATGPRGAACRISATLPGA